ncbi:DUF4918 family protein [Flavihumibacter rivuli]|uniref:uracil-DNA glycosylase family protein n=1 Tax=Flavihumibacter rivuli TaxID=2838156 RepID=UPI001BDE090A|nr:uracil-DNA glycosylase family protein [Flavihumibacter rivuli]ULQ56037.1 DUF4918 family protein [Flavihumibacter rivuli]
MSTFANKAIRFFHSLQPPPAIPGDIGVLFPFNDPAVRKVIRAFFMKYYNDKTSRHLMIGINPGRHGAGITGINFTAPRQLRNDCGIDHPFPDQSELSAEFIYAVIDAYGGPVDFYRDFFIAAMSQLGYTRDGKNLNYYDDQRLMEAVYLFALQCLEKEFAFGVKRETVICIGGEKNFRFLQQLNNENQLFSKIIPLPHPRFIMQYRRSRKQDYINEYLKAMEDCMG